MSDMAALTQPRSQGLFPDNKCENTCVMCYVGMAARVNSLSDHSKVTLELFRKMKEVSYPQSGRGLADLKVISSSGT